MKHAKALLLCSILCSCSSLSFPSLRDKPPGIMVSVVAGTAVLRIEVSSPSPAGGMIPGYREERSLSAGDSYRLDLKRGEKAVLSFAGDEGLKTLLEIRKRGQVTRFYLEHGDLIGRTITISD